VAVPYARLTTNGGTVTGPLSCNLRDAARTIAQTQRCEAPTEEPTQVTPTEIRPTEVTPTEATPTEVTPTEVTPTEPTPTDAVPTEITVLPPAETPTPGSTATATAIIPPTGDNTPTPDPGQPTATPEPGQPTQPTTPPTLPPPPPPPPSSGQPGLLIPVTGADQVGTMLNLSSWFAFLGLIFLGLGILTHSAARRAENAVRH